MKMFRLIPLVFLTACSSPPRLVLRQQTPLAHDAMHSVRYPEVIRAYHVGRYVDPNNDLVMHSQHTLYRVEENSRWNLQPGNAPMLATYPPRNAAFSPQPVNDAILAEVNAQRLATIQIKQEARTLSVALARFQAALRQTKTNLQQMAELRTTIRQMQTRLDALAAARRQPENQPPPRTNAPSDLLEP